MKDLHLKLNTASATKAERAHAISKREAKLSVAEREKKAVEKAAGQVIESLLEKLNAPNYKPGNKIEVMKGLQPQTLAVWGKYGKKLEDKVYALLMQATETGWHPQRIEEATMCDGKETVLYLVYKDPDDESSNFRT